MRLSLLVVFALTGIASAAPRRDQPQEGHPMGNRGGYCGTPRVRASAPAAARPEAATRGRAISNILFLDRCVGGCTFTGSQSHDAVASRVAIIGTVPGKTYAFGEFKNFAEQTGADADAEWTAIVDCARKVYSYYNVVVTDVKPTSGTYHRAVISGEGEQLDQQDPAPGQKLLGISDLDCRFIDNMSSFTFSDAHRPFARDAADFVRQVCVTATHEAGHAFGLEHEYQFADGSSACSDPMSYDTGACDPAFRFFRNKPARCGGFDLTPCACSGQTQVSHITLANAFGLGTPAIDPPSIAVTTPQPGGAVGAVIAASGGHERGFDRVDFFINGYKWGSAPGAPFIPGGGQPNPSSYVYTLAKEVPDGVMDIVVKGYDDLGNEVSSETVTATKGAPCATADSCAKGQRCEAGKCFWDPPTGEFGDSCEFSQACVSDICAGPEGSQICSTTCVPNVQASCEPGFVCVGTGVSGTCQLPEEGGCCSTGRSSGVPVAPLVLGVALFGFVALRRRR